MSEPKGTLRILVTGSREWTNRDTIENALAEAVGADTLLHRPVLVHGGAKGADRIAQQVWAGWGFDEDVRLPDWKRHGRAAGMIRNKVMVDRGADICLAFIRDQSPGATHCAGLARAAGIPVRVFREES